MNAAPSPTVSTVSANADHAAVDELIADIAGEMHLHLARVHEFMEGTPDFVPIADRGERDRLVALRDALSDAICRITSA